MISRHSKRLQHLSSPSSSQDSVHANQILTTDVWKYIFDYLDIQDRMRLRAVCSLFNQIVRQHCTELSLCIRLPNATIKNFHVVRPFYQHKLDRRGHKHSNYTNGLLVWSNENKLIQRLPHIFSYLRTLKLYQNSNSIIYTDIQCLASLRNLKKLKIDGKFVLINKANVQLTQVQRLVMNIFCSRSKRQCDIWTSFPNLTSFQGSNHLFENCRDPLPLLKLHIIDLQLPTDRFSKIFQVCELEQLSITCINLLLQEMTEPLIEFIKKMKHLRKLQLNLNRIRLFEDTIKNDEYLANQISKEKRNRFHPLLYSLCSAIYQINNFSQIEFRINGFLMTSSDMKSSFCHLCQYLANYPFDRNFADEHGKLDRFKADKVRSIELRQYWINVGKENQLLNHRIEIGNENLIFEKFFFSNHLSTTVIDHFLRVAPSLTQLILKIHNSVFDEPDNELNLRFLTKLPCLQRLFIHQMPPAFLNEMADITPFISPFFDSLYLESSFTYHISLDIIVELFKVFSLKAQRHPHIKHTFYVFAHRNVKSVLMKIKKEKNFHNVLLYHR